MARIKIPSHYQQTNQSTNQSICWSIIDVRVFDELTPGVIFNLTVKEEDWPFLADFISVSDSSLISELEG